MNEIIGRIHNQANAEVHVLKAPGDWIHGHGWHCTGCSQGTDPQATTSLTSNDARKAAEKHANTCRFISSPGN